MLLGAVLPTARVMWNCTGDTSNVTWWRVHSVLCGIWASQTPMSASGESQNFSATEEGCQEAGPLPPPMGRFAPEEVGERWLGSWRVCRVMAGGAS